MKITLHTDAHTISAGRRYDEVVFPEFAPARVYKDREPKGGRIITLGPRNWKVRFDLGFDNDGVPAGGVVHFEETTEPESPFVLMAPVREGYYPPEHFFGQPTFKQFPVVPYYNGVQVALLRTIESGWGDCGNENIFLALDEAGMPAGLYHEYSCA